MADPLSKAHRSWLMSRISGADTKPEWILRSALHRLGFRFRLRDRRLPGRPDLVFRKYRAVVFVHGCFWHRHAGCRDGSTPKTNTAYWEEKFARNVERDRKNQAALVEMGWRVRVVWECELLKDTLATVAAAAAWLRESEAGPSTTQASHGSARAGRTRIRYEEIASELDRKELLAVAEKRVAYRLDASGRERPRKEPPAEQGSADDPTGCDR